MTETRKVPTAELVLDERLQARVATDPDALKEYEAAYRAKVLLPPLEVYRVDGKLHVVDGYHRRVAATNAGVRWLRVVVVGEGTIEEAIWYATGANRTHGLRRSNADKRRAVRMALESPIGQEQSSRVIAEHCGVSPDFVARVREEIEPELSLDDSSEAPKRRGKDGKLRSVSRAPRRSRSGKAAEAAEVGGPTGEGGARGNRAIDDDLPPSVPQAEVDEPLPFEPAEAMPDFGPVLDALVATVRGTRITCRRQLPEELNALRQRVEKLLSEAEHAIEYAVPVACPRCYAAGCMRCGGRGWSTRAEAAR